MNEPSYRRHPDLRLTSLEGEGVVLHLRERRYFSVSETGLVLLEALKQARTFDELVEGLLSEYEVDRETAVATTRALRGAIAHHRAHGVGTQRAPHRGDQRVVAHEHRSGVRLASLAVEVAQTQVVRLALGVAAGALDHALEWAKTREQFGRPIGEFQGLQWMLADMQTQLTAARLMLYQAARSRGPDNGEFPDPMLAAQAKIFASETAIKIVNDALQFFGARGYSRELPLERMARDVRMFTIGGGTAQVLRTLVASKLLGWKLPQTRDGYLPKPSMRDAAE